MATPISTRDRIIHTSIDLFNKNGLGNVSIRDIAREMGISHSNILYHFQGIDGLMDAIYSRMETEVTAHIDENLEKASLRLLQERFLAISRFQRRYRFFYIDLQEIARKFPGIIARYRELVEKQIGEYEELTVRMIRNGLIRKEPVDGRHSFGIS